jgi:TRAP transporter TAXI family solute receptor
MKKIAVLGSMLIACLLFSGLAEAKATKIKWGATSTRSGLYANTVAQAALVNQTFPEIEITVVETGGYVENLVRTQKKTIHLGPASAAAAYAAYAGIIDYEGKQLADLRSLWGGYVTPIHIVTSKKSGVTRIEDLNGVSFAMNPGTTSGRLIELLFDALDIKPDYKMMGIGASVDAMKGGVVEGWMKAGFKDAAIMDIESTMEINVLTVTQEMIDKMNAKYPAHGLMMTIPAGLFNAVTAEQLSFAYVVSDFVHKDVPDEVVEKILKATYDKREELVSNIATLREGRFADMYDVAIEYNLAVPFHPAAAKFYQETLGVTIPENLLPPK